MMIIYVPWVEQSTSVSFDDPLIAALEDWDTVESSCVKVAAPRRTLDLNSGFSLWSSLGLANQEEKTQQLKTLECHHL